jgi:uncharacterized protein (DUF885 family)
MSGAEPGRAAGGDPGSSSPEGDGAVGEVFADLQRHLAAYAPTTATRFGDHDCDHDLDDWPIHGADERLRDLSRLRARLDAARPHGGNPRADGDYALVDDELAEMCFELEGLAVHARDPLYYLDLATGGIHDLIRRDDLPVEPQQRAAAHRARQVPRLLAQAKANLTATSGPHRQVALLRAAGAEELFAKTLPAFAPQAGEACEAAAQAVSSFAAWLEDGSGGADADWRLGPGRWAEALRLVVGAGIPAEEVWHRAQAELARLEPEAEQAASQLLGSEGAGLRGGELIRAGFQTLARSHPGREELVPRARQILGELTELVDGLDEFSVPPSDRLRVEEVPAFQQGVTVAYFMPAPPLEPAAPHTYYLSPVPEGWEPERAESFLREYNECALWSVGLHETYPGHCLQAVHAQQHPRLVRRALGNSAFTEGWAVYAEGRAVAQGFSGRDGARMRLASLKMRIRAVANALVDQGLHVHGWDDETALSVLADRAYQEHSEANGKLVRAKVTAGQLSSYFVGAEGMADLRRDVENEAGPAFDAAAFHRRVLDEGALPFEALRRAILNQPDRTSGWRRPA